MSRILVIEDEFAMRHALEDLLTSQGHRVITAADGAIGLERARTERPDLVLLDVMLPKVDGFTLAAELRRRAARCRFCC
jgi:DNA-binding response OmpR family regulator